jgi:hypothetical protein
MSGVINLLIFLRLDFFASFVVMEITYSFVFENLITRIISMRDVNGVGSIFARQYCAIISASKIVARIHPVRLKIFISHL